MRKSFAWLRRHWEWLLAPFFAVVVVVLLPHDCGDNATRDVTVQTPVVVATRTPFAPIRVVRLEIEGDSLVIGQHGTLLNGICNDSRIDVATDIYFGLQEVGKDPIAARHIDLVGTPRNPMRYTVPAGPICQRTEPIEATVDSRLLPGRWQLVLNMTAFGPLGEQQNITATSKPFDVVAGP